jgi:hypothetical protein
VIRHLPHNAPAKDISDGLKSLGFDVVSVKNMIATRRSPPEESKIIYLPLFLVTLSRTAKTQENFRLSRICHIAIRVEAYRAQSALTQCHNCSSSATSGQTESSLPAACGAEAVTNTRRAPRKEIRLPLQYAAIVGWRKEKNSIPQIIGVTDT